MEGRLIMEKPAKFKRTQYLVKKEFQLKYVGMILAMIFLTAGLCSYVVYYTSMISLGEKLANVYPQGRLVSIVKAVNFRILLSVIFITPLVALVGLLASHRIAGPIYRMESFLKAMGEGNFTSRITLRKGDELTTLADGMNDLADSMKSNIMRQKAQMEKTIEELDNVKKLADATSKNPTKIDSAINKLDSEIAALLAELNKYKV